MWRKSRMETNAAQSALGLYDRFDNWQNNKWAKGNQAASSKRNLLLFQAQKDWEKTKMQSAHQWEVEDLHKAGLNPILSLGGQGATGQSAPSGGNSAGGTAGSLNSARTLEGFNSILALANQEKNTAANTAVAEATKAKIDAETEAINAKNPYIPEREKSEIAKLKAERISKDLENEFQENSFGDRLTILAGEAEEGKLKGALTGKDMKMLMEYGITRKELFDLGAGAIRLIASAIKGGVGAHIINKLKNDLLTKSAKGARTAKR